MYNEQIEQLIEFALADGEITEKDRQVLFKKAESFGINLDEFEMVLDARLFVKNQVKSDIPPISLPKSDKLGDIRKCPACGALAETFATKCADCGTEFRNIQSSRNITVFFEKLNEIELSRKDSIYNEQDNKSNISFGTIIKWLLFWIILLPLKIINFFINRSKPSKWSITDVRKEELIINFPVPVSREEILEFLTLASSKINTNTYFNTFSEETKYKNAWNKIWFKKIEQIQSKAYLAMNNDKRTLDDVNRIAENSRLVVAKNNKKMLRLTLVYIVLMMFFLALVVSFFSLINSNNKLFEQQNLLKTKAEILIKKKQYDKAEEIIFTLFFQDDIVELESKIELTKLTQKLNELEVLLPSKDYSKLKLELGKVKWTKQSNNYSTESTELEVYKVFVERKAALNNQLPEEYRIEIESEDSL